MEQARRHSRSESDHLQGTDSELLRKAQHGDDAAFHELVDRYAGSLFRLAVALVGNEADAEDVVQETILGAFRHMGAFQRRSSVKTWLFRILSKRAARCHRSRRRHPTVPFRETSEASELTPGHAADASAADRIDTRLDILETIGALSTPHQQVVVLRELEGMSYAEIAEVLNVPRGTVESRLFRARQELKKRLRGYLP
jgi:RNA polymerase sigma-70 factor (ECF subfamily)